MTPNREVEVAAALRAKGLPATASLAVLLAQVRADTSQAWAFHVAGIEHLVRNLLNDLAGADLNDESEVHQAQARFELLVQTITALDNMNFHD